MYICRLVLKKLICKDFNFLEPYYFQNYGEITIIVVNERVFFSFWYFFYTLKKRLNRSKNDFLNVPNIIFFLYEMLFSLKYLFDFVYSKKCVLTHIIRRYIQLYTKKNLINIFLWIIMENCRYSFNIVCIYIIYTYYIILVWISSLTLLFFNL